MEGQQIAKVQFASTWVCARKMLGLLYRPWGPVFVVRSLLDPAVGLSGIPSLPQLCHSSQGQFKVSSLLQPRASSYLRTFVPSRRLIISPAPRS